MNHHIHFIQQVKFKRNSYFSYSRGYGSKELITTTPFKFFKSVSVRSQKNADLSELLPLRLVQKYIHQIEMEHKGWTCFKAPYISCHGMTMLSWDVFFPMPLHHIIWFMACMRTNREQWTKILNKWPYHACLVMKCLVFAT